MGRAAHLVALIAWVLPSSALAQLSASPDPLDVGSVRVGEVANASVTLSNATVMAENVTCSIAPADSGLGVASCPASVAADGGTAAVVVDFAPTSPGAKAAILTIDYELAGRPLSETVAINGQGIAPEMIVTIVPASTEPLDFGDALVGSDSPVVFAIRVANAGDDVLDASIDESGSNPGDWSYAPPGTSFAIAPGEVRNLVATFTPSSSGPRSATVTVRDDSGLSTVPVRAISMIGTGRAPRLESSPGGLSFGAVAVGAQSAPQTVTIANAGDADLTITSVDIPGANDEDYLVTGFGGPVVLSPSEDLEVSVAFRPQDLGAQNGVLVVESDSPVPPATDQVVLSGSGQGTADVTLSPLALTFGAIDVQTGEAVTRVVAVGNSGDGPLQVTALRLEGLDGEPFVGEQFTLLTGAPLVVPEGEERAIEVEYHPAFESVGDYAVLVLETDAPSVPEVEVTLSGRGVDRHIAVSHEQVTFAPTYRNPADPPAIELVVQNTGESPLRLDAVMLEGEGASSFVLVGALDDEIPALGSSTVVIEFRPRVAAEDPADPIEATLLLVNDDDDRTRVGVDLSGLGILPPIVPSYDAIDWGSVAVGLDLPPPGRSPFVLRNESPDRSFVVQEVRVVDEAGQPMDAVRAAGFRDPVELAPGEELSLDVAFAPSRGGEFRGYIEVLVDADPEPVVRVRVGGAAVEGSVRGGGGCRVGGGEPTGGSGWLLWCAVVAWSLGRRRGARRDPPGHSRGRRRIALTAGCLVALISGARDAEAQVQASQDLDLASFRPVHGVEPPMVTVESSGVGAAGSFAVGLSLDYARNPLVFEPAGTGRVDYPVSDRATTELAGAFAFGDHFEVSAVVPFLTQTGDQPMSSGISPASGTAVGDLRLRGKAFIASRGALSLGSAAEVSLPTGLDRPFAGGHGPSAQVRAIADYRAGRTQLALNAGGVMRQRVRLADVEQGHELIYGLAAAVHATPRLSGVAELFGGIGLAGGPAGARPLEMVLASRIRVTREVGLLAGAGRGLLAGVGAPDLRLFVAIGWSPGASPIVAPGQDPRLMTDDDRDGILARDDRCPEEREDVDGFADQDGCPDADDDGDGIADGADRCPRRAEDVDGFADQDGCPDPDNDGDGVLDAVDRCPGEAEDVDGFEDADGCPELDNDHDGVADSIDRCPAEPETINGNQDDDGCADPGDSLVQVTATRIEVFEPIRFRGDTAVLTRTTQRALGQIAATLRANPEIRRLRIRAHVHDRGAQDDELSVKRAEAVRLWLVEWGIAADRLEGVGFGSRQPLVQGTDARSRALNDRVDLEIAERMDAR